MKALIVDDHPVMRCGMKCVLQSKDQQLKILEEDEVEHAKTTVQNEKPDYVIVDLSLGKASGFELIRDLKEHAYKGKIIVFTSSRKRADVEQAMKYNVSGYIGKDACMEDVLYGIQLIDRGDIFYSNSIMKLYLEGINEKDKLTIREQEVIGLIRNGDTNAQIGDKLYISEGTVKKHVSSILAKLNLKRRVEIIRYANDF